MLLANVCKSYNTSPDTLYFGAQDTLHFRQFLDQVQVYTNWVKLPTGHCSV